MRTESNYIMRDQVRDLIPSLMDEQNYDNQKPGENAVGKHLVTTVSVVFCYLLVMALSAE